MGIGANDDAAVYRLSDDTALIQTVDFFTPVVDDPFLFGQIAAANALSDVYAMGGRPLLAMNIAAFPCQFSDIFTEVFRGGALKIEEAGAILVGGHSLEDKEPKYGLSVTGLVHPDRVITNGNAKAGDALVLTKPLGFGVLATALKQGILTETKISGPIAEALRLNEAASQAMIELGADACTDVSGFGFLGHLEEMLIASGVAAQISASAIPVWSRALKLAQDGCIPGGTVRNRAFFGERITYATPAAEDLDDILFDPQTSGGLLIAIASGKADGLISVLNKADIKSAAVIGEITAQEPGFIEVS